MLTSKAMKMTLGDFNLNIKKCTTTYDNTGFPHMIMPIINHDFPGVPLAVQEQGINVDSGTES